MSSPRPPGNPKPGGTPAAPTPGQQALTDALKQLTGTIKELAETAAAPTVPLAKGPAAPPVSPGLVDAALGRLAALGSYLSGTLTPALTRSAAAMTSLFGQLASGFGVAHNQLVQLAAAANPAAAYQLNLAYRSLTFTLGQVLQPVAQGAARFLQGLADTLYNLSPATKAILAGVAGLSVVLLALLPAIATATTAFISLGGAVGFATAGLSVVAGALAVALAGAGTAAVAFGVSSGKLAGALESLGALFADLLDVLDDAAEGGLPAVAGVVLDLAKTLGALLAALRPAVEEWVRLDKATGGALTKLLAAAVAGAAFVEVALPGIELLSKAVAELEYGLRRLVVTLEVLAARRFNPREIFGDFTGVLAEIDARMAALETKRDRSRRAPPGPVDVRATTAEEYARQLNRSALAATFGAGQALDPARKAEAQRDALRSEQEKTNSRLDAVEYLRKVMGQ